jgi:uncharacterized membrane protein YbhN (UPF0104 family)
MSRMWQRVRRWWPVGKVLLAVVILIMIGRLFARDLPAVWQHSFNLGWLAAAGALYLLGLGFSAVYWQRLLVQVGQRPSWAAVVRAYYIGHLGKYVPGKAWALLLRSDLARGPGVTAGYAGLTAFYEVLTSMAAGALLAAVLLLALLPDPSAALDWQALGRVVASRSLDQVVLHPGALVLLALALFVPIALPLLPPFFNRVVHRLARRFRDKDAAPLARLEARVLPEGLALTMVGWSLLGLSTWAALRATAPELPWAWGLWGRLTALMGIAYVIGFVVLVMPGAVGVRELCLVLFLTPELVQVLALGEEEARKLALAAVVALRVTWTVAELIMATAVYWLPAPAAPKGGEA